MARETGNITGSAEWIKAYKEVIEDIEDAPAEAFDDLWTGRYLLDAVRRYNSDIEWPSHEIKKGLADCLSRFRREVFSNQNNREALKEFMTSRSANLMSPVKVVTYTLGGVRYALSSVISGFVSLSAAREGVTRKAEQVSAMELILEGHLYALMLASKRPLQSRQKTQHLNEWLNAEHPSVFIL